MWQVLKKHKQKTSRPAGNEISPISTVELKTIWAIFHVKCILSSESLVLCDCKDKTWEYMVSRVEVQKGALFWQAAERKLQFIQGCQPLKVTWRKFDCKIQHFRNS